MQWQELFLQRHAGGLAGVALGFEIDRDAGEKILNLFRCGQLAEECCFLPRQANGPGKGSIKSHELQPTPSVWFTEKSRRAVRMETE